MAIERQPVMLKSGPRMASSAISNRKFLLPGRSSGSLPSRSSLAIVDLVAPRLQLHKETSFDRTAGQIKRRQFALIAFIGSEPPTVIGRRRADKLSRRRFEHDCQ